MRRVKTAPLRPLLARSLVAVSALTLALGCRPSPGPPDGDLPDGAPTEPVGSPSCDRLDLRDWDGDGLSDQTEGDYDSDSDGLPDRFDTDSDDDGRDDAVEAGLPSCDGTPRDSDSDGLADYRDSDSDNNGIPDEQETDDDLDDDGVPHWRDPDDDGDGIDDATELGPNPRLDPQDTDGDGALDAQDSDSDGDGIDDAIEGAGDLDRDGWPNYRDDDSDGDGVADQVEGEADCDGDGLGNFVDTDSDGDGVADWEPEPIHRDACPPCSPDCESSGEIEPDAEAAEADGLVPNPDGPGVVIGTESIDAGFAWIANSEEPWPDGSGSSGTVTKLDLETGEEVGRFVVGLPGQDNSPSRTAVDGNSDAYIACRAFGQQGTVVKIAASPEDCIDRNHNGRIDTSSDAMALAFGEDECLLWTAEVGRLGATPRALVVDLGGLDTAVGVPWVGLHDARQMLRLDPDDGTILTTVAVTTSPYGAAIDSAGSIWIASFYDGQLQRLDATTLAVDPALHLDDSGCFTGPYGVAVDDHDRVWVGTHADSACRYDPADGSWFQVRLPDPELASRGVAVDGFGVVWLAAHGSVATGGEGWLYGFDADDGSGLRGVATQGSTPVGVAVDSEGFVWAVNQGSDTASRLDPSTEEVDLFPVGQGPYTYSDFTGFQRARVHSQGQWSAIIEACVDRSEQTELDWGDLVWEAATPGATTIELLVQTAATEAGLADAEVLSIATAPTASPPVSIADALAAAGVIGGWFLRLTAVLHSTGARSPALETVEVSWECGEGPLG